MNNLNNIENVFLEKTVRIQPNHFQENYQIVDYRINSLHATVQNDFHYHSFETK